MKRLIFVSYSLLLLSTGFFVGRYADNIMLKTIDVAETPIETTTLSPLTSKTVPPKIEYLAQTANLPSIMNTANKASVPPVTNKPLLPHEMFATPQAQAQLAAQQWEAQHAEIQQMDAMIRSMEDSGLPAEEINHFRELKKAKEEPRLVDNPQPPAASQAIEHTDAEREQEFSASLQQAGIPLAEREKLLESFASQPTPPEQNITTDTPRTPHEKQ